MEFETLTLENMREVNVLEVIGNADKGGMENFLKNFISHLPKQKLNLTCICPYESEFTKALRNLGVNDIYIARIEDDPYWRSIQLAVEIGKLKKIDVFHAHMPKAHLLAGIAGSLLNKPVVATVHGMDITAHELGIARAVGSHLITNNQEAYIQAVAMGVPTDHLNLVRNGVDIDIFNPELKGNTFRNLINVPLSTPLIGFVGRLANEKGPDLFLKAAEFIHHERPDVHFVIVGEGDMKKQLEKLCFNMQLSPYVHFVKWQSNNWDVYPALDVLAHTSRSDGTSLVLLEAMACGVPTVAIGVGGVPEIVEHGSTGLLVNQWEGIAPQIIYLLENPKIRKAMGIAARLRVKEYFNVRTNTERTAGIINDIALAQNNRFKLPAHSYKNKKSDIKIPVRSMNN
jgi:glycosyltransferase involved in cell wall biosynthesis